MRILIENRHLVILAIAETVTSVGSWITMMAIFSILVFEGGGGVSETSAVMFAALVPLLIASPVAGALADRFDRKRLMIASQWLLGLVITALIFTESKWMIYALLATASVVGSVMSPARQAVVPVLVGREQLTRANALLAQLSSASKIGAPILAGAVLAVVPARQAMVLDVVTFAAAGLLLTRLPSLPAPRVRSGGKEDGSATALPAGDDGDDGEQPGRATVLGTFRRYPQLQLFFVTVFLASAAIVGFDLVVTIFTRDTLGGGESLFGLLVAAVGLGAFLSSGLLMWRGQGRDAWRDVLVGLFLLIALTASIPIADALGAGSVAIAVAMVGALIGGIGSGLITVQATTLMQLLAPAEVLGRIAGILQSTIISAQLTSMLLLPLVMPDRISMAQYGMLASVALALVVIVSALVLGRLRDRQKGEATLSVQPKQESAPTLNPHRGPTTAVPSTTETPV